MKLPTLVPILLTAVIAAPAGWWAARRLGPLHATEANTVEGARRILFYQSAMHPWIKSDTPGKCTICGMELTPVFEGEIALDLEPGMVSLPSNSITVIHVRSTELSRGPLVRHLRVAGLIEPDETRRRILSAYIAGRIEALSINYTGAEVAQGQPLARFYSPLLLEAERQFLALARLTPATAHSGEGQLLRQSAQQRLRQLGLTDPQILALPDKDPTQHWTDLLSPMSGTVIERFVLAGQYVAEGDPLFEIADLSTLWFRFDAYERDLPWIEPGQGVQITAPALGHRTLRAPIQFIDPTLDPRTRSAKVRVEIPNPPKDDGTGRRLLPNRLYAEGLVTIESPEVLLIPRTAVLSPEGRPRTYLDHGGGAYERRDLTLGRFGDDAYEVLGGVEVGDRVVLNGNLLIDAQAQLNQAVHAPDHDHTAAPVSAPTSFTIDLVPPSPASLPPSQRASLRRFLEVADALRAALAEDDMPAFLAAREALTPAAGALRTSLDEAGAWEPWLQTVVDAAELPAAADLRAARGAYFPFSQALVGLARVLRAAESDFATLKIYRCPMTADAFTGAPRRTEWLQLGPPLRNPWFGAEMLECGVEVTHP